MKALVLNGIGEDPAIAHREITEPERGQVRVRLEAAALNRRDIWIRRGQYPGIRYPIILGSDGCGVVESAGEGADDWVGRRVILYPGFDWARTNDVRRRTTGFWASPITGPSPSRSSRPWRIYAVLRFICPATKPAPFPSPGSPRGGRS